MTEDLRKRLIGAAVLVSLAVIFVPMLLEDDSHTNGGLQQSNIPQKQLPAFEPPAISPQALAEKQQAFEQQQALDAPRQEASQQAFDSSIKPDQGASVEPVVVQGSDEQSSKTSKPVKTRVGLSSWMIQVGSFSNHDNATKVVSQLREAGYDTHLETAQVQSKKVHRVRVGPEIDKARAEAKAKEIAKKFFHNPKVIRYP